MAHIFGYNKDTQAHINDGIKFLILKNLLISSSSFRFIKKTMKMWRGNLNNRLHTMKNKSSQCRHSYKHTHIHTHNIIFTTYT